MEPAEARGRLIRQLQLAYSGELAAAFAYRGHWRSVRDPEERVGIRRIEEEELHHRKLVGGMLRELGAGPSRAREIRQHVVGRILQVLCHVSGWFAPMYGAGRLESRNVEEYVVAARHARACGREDLIECLLTMAEVEWDHERYFRGKIEGHALTRVFRLWPALGPRELIRRGFAVDEVELRASKSAGQSEATATVRL